MTFHIVVKRLPLEFSFDAGSLKEAAAILSDNSNALSGLYQEAAKAVDMDEAAVTTTSLTPLAPPALVAAAEAPKPGRPRKPRNDPANAQAPAPAPIPGVPAAPPAPVAPPATPPMPPASAGAPPAPPAAADGLPGEAIPNFLQRPAGAAPAPIAPPPPAPAAAPAPAVPPVQGVLGQKIVADLEARAKGSVDGGKALADWLAQCGIVQPGATFTEAMSVVKFSRDDQLTGVAQQLGVTA